MPTATACFTPVPLSSHSAEAIGPSVGRRVMLAFRSAQRDRSRRVHTSDISRAGENPKRAELGFIIAEPYRGRGIASLLLSHLVRIAQEKGLSAFEAQVLAYNAPTLAVLQRSGLPICRRREGDIIHVTLSLSPHKDLTLSAPIIDLIKIKLLRHAGGRLRSSFRFLARHGSDVAHRALTHAAHS